jgi:hypothetical protein
MERSVRSDRLADAGVVPSAETDSRPPQTVAWPKYMKDRPMMKKAVVALFFLGITATIAQAIDMQDLAPCRPAAARFCERSGGMTWSNLLRCGATLAAHSFRIGDSCREVLRRYGQL